jgi:hypothetical protein
MTVITIGDCAVVTQGENIDKKFLNTDKKELPEKSFKDSGTNVNTCLVIVNKKGAVLK